LVKTQTSKPVKPVKSITTLDFMKRLPPLNALRAFSTVAQTGSFTKAGHEMHVTQGAISRQVKLLEESIGTRLFVRVHQSIIMTPAGRELANVLETAFGLMEIAVEKAGKTQPRQLLAINVPPTFATRWLAPRLSDFRFKHPQIDLSITTDTIQNAKALRHHDCLVIFDQLAWPTSACELLMLERHVMACSPDLWNDNLPPSLNSATLLHILNGEQRLPVWEQWMATHGSSHVDTQPGLNFSTLDQAINASVAGAGVAIVDKSMIVKELKSGMLRRFDARQIDGPNGYWFIDVTHNSARKELVSVFQQWLLAQIQWATAAES
jgi:DNA-binding transcriptional LysR family regulator